MTFVTIILKSRVDTIFGFSFRFSDVFSFINILVSTLGWWTRGDPLVLVLGLKK